MTSLLSEMRRSDGEGEGEGGREGGSRRRVVRGERVERGLVSSTGSSQEDSASPQSSVTGGLNILSL